MRAEMTLSCIKVCCSAARLTFSMAAANLPPMERGVQIPNTLYW